MTEMNHINFAMAEMGHYNAKQVLQRLKWTIITPGGFGRG